MQCKVDGLIVSNTTTSRPDSLTSASKSEPGGLSGAPLREMATKTVADFYRLTNGELSYKIAVKSISVVDNPTKYILTWLGMWS